ncbi:MAG: nucleotide sugar dehydrogenase [Chloroflexota bacterium]|nr:nucleotide sugar dehydrogenase [Chloroflexota bacterium]
MISDANHTEHTKFTGPAENVNHKEELLRRLGSAEAHVAVIGLGYVGLPLALLFAQGGYRVTGIDVDSRKVDAINNGSSYIEDVSSESLQAMLSAGLLSATTDFGVLARCDAVSICVPTPLRKTGDPDISYILASTEEVARYIHPGMVVVLESTTYPGTTTEVVLPLLARSSSSNSASSSHTGDSESSNSSGSSNLRIGEDFFLAFSPERVDPGRTDWTTRTTPKVIGGVTSACQEVAIAYYGRAIDTLVPVSSTEAAEMVKLLENTFRAVNIGLVNEVLLMCDKLGLDAWEVIDAAATKPFGFMKFTPGPGLGGHCIPIDPLYLSWKLRTLNYTARFIDLASEVNTGMPAYWVQKVQDALNDVGKAVNGSRVLVLGVAYKKDVSDIRESPALDIVILLQEKGAEVSYHDPHVPGFHHEGLEMVCVTDLERALAQSDCVVIVTDHTAYDWEQIREGSRMVVDTRRVLGKARPVAAAR